MHAYMILAVFLECILYIKILFYELQMDSNNNKMIALRVNSKLVMNG